MSEVSMRVRGFAYDLHVAADRIEALEAELAVERGERDDDAFPMRPSIVDSGDTVGYLDLELDVQTFA